MPSHMLKLLSVRYHTPNQIASLLKRAPAIADQADKIMELAQQARQDFKQAQVAASSETIASPAATKSKNHPAPEPLSRPVPSMEDVWSDLTAGPAAQSSLFGSTIRVKSTSAKAVSKGRTSGLFGSTLRRDTLSASPFDEIKRDIHERLAPAPSVSVAKESEVIAPVSSAATADSRSEPISGSGTVPILVDDKTHSTSTASAAPVDKGPSPPKRAKRDEIVQVKKKSQKARPAQASSLKTASNAPSPSFETVNGPSKEQKKAPKKRLAAGSIPEFDYSKAPNLLDNPKSGLKDAGEKKKKKEKKKERKGELTGGLHRLLGVYH